MANEKRGFLEIVFGPMFCGKTTYLIEKANDIEESAGAANVVLCVNSERDTRVDGNFLQSHDGKRVEAVKEMNLELVRVDCRRPFSDYTHVLIDEANFYPDLVPQVLQMVRDDKKHVVVAGLRGTSERRAFGSLLELVPEADVITSLNSVCAVCGDVAPFTMCTKSKQGAMLVGGAESYKPVCRLHHTDAAPAASAPSETETPEPSQPDGALRSILKQSGHRSAGETKKVTLNLPSSSASTGFKTSSTGSTRMQMSIPSQSPSPPPSLPQPIRVDPAPPSRTMHTPVYNPDPEQLHATVPQTPVVSTEETSEQNQKPNTSPQLPRAASAPIAIPKTTKTSPTNSEMSVDEWRTALEPANVNTLLPIDAAVPYVMSLLDNDEMQRQDHCRLLDRLREITEDIQMRKRSWEGGNDMTIPWNMLCYRLSEGLEKHRNRPFARNILAYLQTKA